MQIVSTASPSKHRRPTTASPPSSAVSALLQLVDAMHVNAELLTAKYLQSAPPISPRDVVIYRFGWDHYRPWRCSIFYSTNIQCCSSVSG